MKRVITVIAMATVIPCLAVPGVLRADDIEIYGPVSVEVQPNVLIIFDTSESMDTAPIPDESGVEIKTRIQAAKEVITGLINDTENVRFGLMRFNDNNQGGRIIAECGSDKTTLINTINSIVAGGYTPLAETLAEAGLYFAGMKSWYKRGVTYTSPMQYRCQKNYIILMTDGESSKDSDPNLCTQAYISGKIIGDYDQDGNESGCYSGLPEDQPGSDYLDDVAKYLYENDCNPTLGTGTSFEKQNIIIYTIGFEAEQKLLQDTAFNGGGQYYPANNISGLSEAFEEIMSTISEVNATFVSPVVPVSSMNLSYAGNYLYLGLFKPMPSGRWLGNLKKYGLGSDGELLDVNGEEATLPSGRIKEEAVSYWSSGYPDGPDVDEGGAGEVLLNQTTRNLCTYIEDDPPVLSLLDLQNQFSESNTKLTHADLGLSTDDEKNDLINKVHTGEWSDGEKTWILGDILHSQPIVVHYDMDEDGVLDATYIFAGSNDGMMHCFDDSDGSEVWGFIPPEQLPRLPLLLNSNHDYFVDGSPVIYERESQKILFFGERRGGTHYYALDVTAINEPQWLYKIEPNILGGGDAQLGQSWCKPEIHKVKTGNEADPEHTVFLMAGGYDRNQDLATPASTDSVGRAVFAVKVSDGTVSTLDFNAANYPAMTHSIVEVSGFDTDADGFMNRAYAGDLGGHMFAFEDDDGDGGWSVRKLFSASAVDGIQRKIFYAPDAVEEPFGELIFFGTGDRADPRETGVENRFYVVKNEWVADRSFTTLSESDLVDVTDDLIQLGTAEQKAQVQRALETSKGWYIRLENPGEKVTASPTVFAGVVYFTTYTPSPEGTIVNPDDPCEAPTASGVARLYAVDYLTGAAVRGYSPTVEIDRETGVAAKLGKLDRSKVIGSGIPSAPVVAVLESGAQIFLGVEGGVVQETPVAKTDMNIFYWRQIFF